MFPLPNGCRTVCKKQTRPVLTKDVVRWAKAAVKNGDDPCQIAREVTAAVGCVRCESQIAEVETGLDAIREDTRALIDAIINLLAALGIDDPRGGPVQKDDSAIRRILRYLGFFGNLYDLIQAILELADAFSQFEGTFFAFLDALGELLTCIRE